MNAELTARFRKQFSSGFSVETDVRMAADRFSLTVLFGPSGCGKTTTLRCLAGLERPEEGRISIGDTTWFDSAREIFLPPQRRGIGYLFQDYALFPHLTARDNIGFGLERLPHEERTRRIDAMLDLFELDGLAGRFPHQVSGGEQQRIALARVLVLRPRLLLLDEPLAALDQPIREQLRPKLRSLLAQFSIPVILITHDRAEAMALADEVIVLDQGKVRQRGPVAGVFSHPAGVEVARIVGTENVLPGRIERVEGGLATVEVGSQHLVAVAPSTPGNQVFVCIRAEEVVLHKGPLDQISPRNRLSGIIQSITLEGPLTRVFLDCGFELQALITKTAREEMGLASGQTVTVLVKAPSVHLIGRS